VNRRLLPGVAEREELNRLLRVHDPDDSAPAGEIAAKHAPMLRQIALEASHTGGDPNARKRAIAWLGQFATAEDLNVLVGLAQYDADPTVRGAAVLGLGASGLQLAAPILAAALRSRDAVEAAAASKALSSLADRIGQDRVLASISSVRDAGLSKLAKKALAMREAKTRRAKSAPTRAD